MAQVFEVVVIGIEGGLKMFGRRSVLVPAAMRTGVCSPMRATRRRARLQRTRVWQHVVRHRIQFDAPAFHLLVGAEDLLHPSGHGKILEDGGASQVKDNGANDANIKQLQKQEKTALEPNVPSANAYETCLMLSPPAHQTTAHATSS